MFVALLELVSVVSQHSGVDIVTRPQEGSPHNVTRPVLLPTESSASIMGSVAFPIEVVTVVAVAERVTRAEFEAEAMGTRLRGLGASF